jgi:ATP-dependent exoDNAse (exonuclease V) alpha subunit
MVCSVDWNDKNKAEIWRKAWADEVNAFFLSQSVNERIDHRSYERQGIEIIPQIKMGAAATNMERKGIRTERGNRNREIKVTNNQPYLPITISTHKPTGDYLGIASGHWIWKAS